MGGVIQAESTGLGTREKAHDGNPSLGAEEMSQFNSEQKGERSHFLCQPSGLDEPPTHTLGRDISFTETSARYSCQLSPSQTHGEILFPLASQGWSS